jgi:hypothetical protein
MTPESIVKALQVMEPEQLQKVFEQATRMFSNKAEALYDQDPENNGRLAQPYADLAMMMESAAMVWEEEESGPPVDGEELSADAQQTPKLSEVVSATRGDPWGGR